MTAESTQYDAAFVVGLKGVKDSSDPKQTEAFYDLFDSPLMHTCLQIALRAHPENQTRKIKPTPYLAHPLETSFLAHYLASQFLSEKEAERVSAGALLHDVFEMHPENKDESSLLTHMNYAPRRMQREMRAGGIPTETAQKIVQWVTREIPLLSTDEEEIDHYSTLLSLELSEDGPLDFAESHGGRNEISWRRRKRADLVRTIVDRNGVPINDAASLFIKMVDILAVIEESTRDIDSGIDRGSSDQLFSPERRLHMYSDRYKILQHYINKYYGRHRYFPLFTATLVALKTSLARFEDTIATRLQPA